MPEHRHEAASGHPTTEPPVDGVPSDNTTLTSVLDEMERAGFTSQLLVTEAGGIQCAACGSDGPASAFEVRAARRLEGASDPDDMLLVTALRCPVCGALGTLVMGYGPHADPSVIPVARELARRRRQAWTG